MDASCKIQGNIHLCCLVHKYVSRILGTYQVARMFFELSEKYYYEIKMKRYKCSRVKMVYIRSEWHVAVWRTQFGK